MHKNRDEAIRVLRENKNHFIEFLKRTIQQNSFSYINFGTAIESHILPEIIRVLQNAGVLQNTNDYKLATNKNEFPDLTLRTEPPLALELKSGNRCKIDKGTWKSCKNSANDLGTINMWEKKLSMFNGDDIFYIYIEYKFNEDVQEIIDFKIEPFYKFVGKNRVGLLSYREKDGNLRPKDFDEASPIPTLEKFLELLPETKRYRAERIVKKHLAEFTDEEIVELLEVYKEKIEKSKNQSRMY